jgi:hypothetical protein
MSIYFGKITQYHMVAFHQDVCILYTLDAKNGSSVTVDRK